MLLVGKKMELVKFISNTDSYIIYHPQDFIVDEADDGIVTFTSPTTYSNLTISSYSVSEEVDDNFLISFYKDSTSKYISLSEISNLQSKHGLLLEGWYKKDDISWVWWSIKDNLTILLLSVNYHEMSDEEYSLYRFMIDNISFIN
jgi:hypothetical protein